MAVTSRLPRGLLLGLALGISVSLASTAVALYARTRWKRRIARREPWTPIQLGRLSDEVVDGVPGLVGHTPLVRIASLSRITGCEILGKAEFLNPGGSVKDRVSLQIITSAEEEGFLEPNTDSTIFEGTSGSTGISIAYLCRAKGYNAYIVLPDDVSEDKVNVLKRLGATVEKVRPVSIVSESHYVNVARRRAKEFGDGHIAKGYFVDQFDNLENFNAHWNGTGPEIWDQVSGKIDAFVSGAGTGGTIAGVGSYLKDKDENIKIILADPNGSGLYNKVKYGVMYAPEEQEGKRRRHQVDSVVEGIGLNRSTKNFEQAEAVIDDAYRVTDQEAVSMSRYLMQEDGLFLGSSSAVNLVACVKLAKSLPPGSKIVTILCDHGSRHYSRFWNDKVLKDMEINVDKGIDFL